MRTWSAVAVGVVEGDDGHMMNGHAIGNGHALIGPENQEEDMNTAAVGGIEDAVHGEEAGGTAQDLSPGKALQISTMKAIQGVIEESERFDEVVGESFELLERQASPLEPAKALYLKQKLQITFSEVSASFQVATNSIIPLVSEEELGVLLRLYGLDETLGGAASPALSHLNDSAVATGAALGRLGVHGSSIGSPAVPRRLFGSHGEEGTQLPFIRLNSSLAPGPASQAPGSAISSEITGGLATPSEVSRTSSPRPLLLQTHTADEIGMVIPPSGTASNRRKRPLSLHAVPLAEQSQHMPKRLRTRSYRNSITNIHELEPSGRMRGSAPAETIRGGAERGLDYGLLDQQERTAAWARQRMKTLRADYHGELALPLASPELEGDTEGTPKLGHPKLRMLRLSAASTTSSAGVITPSEHATSTSQSSQTGSPIQREDSGISSPRRDYRTHQRNRSSFSGLGFRQPTSLLSPPVGGGSPKPEARRVSDKSDEVPPLEDFISGLPPDLVMQLRQGPKRPTSVRGGRKPSTGSRPRSSLRFSHRSEAYAQRPSSMRTDSQKASVETSGSQHLVASIVGIDLSNLREAFSLLHVHRRRLSCGLLALQAMNDDGQQPPGPPVGDDSSVQLFWQVLQDVPAQLQQAIRDGAANIGAALRTAKRISRDQLPGAAVSFAPKQTDAQQLQMELEALETILDLAKQRLLDVRHLAVSGSQDGPLLTSQWDLLRADLGMMIRDWERGRHIIGRITGEAESVGLAGSDGGQANHSCLLEAIPDQQDADPSKPEVQDIPLPESPPLIVDDASSHLLNSTSPALLPPPGIEAVFEDYISRLPARSGDIAADGQKMTREQRIAAAKEARQKSQIAERPANQAHGMGGLTTVDRATALRSGEMVDELRDVMTKLRERRELLRDDPADDLPKADNVGVL